MSSKNFVVVKDRKGIILHKSDQIIEDFEKLEPGLYEIYDQGGMFQTLYTFEPIKLEESLVKFRTGVVAEILEKIEKFFSPETTAAYKQMGLMQKMGMIMYGPPGTGKTKTAQMAMLEVAKLHNAICLDATGRTLNFIIQTIDKLREVQSNPIIVFYDEAESTLRDKEEEYLSFLDGNNSVNNFIFLGCTNYLNKIPKRIRERRSRIKHLFEVKSLPHEVYTEYLQSKLPTVSNKEIQKFAYKAGEAGLTIDELKHAVIDYRIDSITIEQAIKNVKEYSKQDDWD